MNQQMIIGLIGEAGFTDILIGLPDEFFNLCSSTQDALWGAVLVQLNEGMTSIKELTIYARQWLEFYPIVKSTVHRAINSL
jgi:hypothetical protein